MKKACLVITIALLSVLVLSALYALLSDRLPAGQKIALVRVEGTIMDSFETIEALKEYFEDPSVKAVVLRVDSPGGAVAPSQEIFEEVQKGVKIKPVIVSMGSLAASGGYYISAPATKIVANPGTITGSIGVIMELPNFKGLMDKIGVKTEVVKSGKHKDIASVFRDLGEEERKLLQDVLDNVHEQFIKAVSEGRNIPVEKVREFADGRIFTGEQAKALGLVDQLGNIEDALDLAREVSGAKDAPVVKKKKKPGIFDLISQKVAVNLPDANPTIKFKYIFSP